MKAPIQIRREDVTSQIRELSELMKVSVTDAVALAVRAELVRQQDQKKSEKAERMKRADALLQKLWSLPQIGPMITDEDLYDEDGLPK
ncbi:MAG: type II toxin-antitoxin system VapB family antitoxin [Acidobacteria bacterium]|nr:type II toxin-antitoxin system VapB family antitoxin [Acidobacteriota bacterium]